MFFNRPPSNGGGQIMTKELAAGIETTAEERINGFSLNSPAHQRFVATSVTVRQGMFEHGYDQAIAAGDLEVQTATIDAIKNHAAAIARECERDFFNSELYTHDKMHWTEHDKHLADRKQAELSTKFAEAGLREHEIRVAAAQVWSAPPRYALYLLAAAAVAGFSLGFVITYHDFFFDFGNESMSWFVSFIAALVTGSAIATMILADTNSTDSEHSATNWIGLGAGLLIAVAFCAIRLQDFTSNGEIAFAVGLMLFEMGLVLGLEGVGARLRKLHSEHAEKMAAATKAEALCAAARTNFERCLKRLSELNAAVNSDIAYVEERTTRHFNIDSLEEALIGAGLDGYNAGIAANQGRILGAGYERRYS